MMEESGMISRPKDGVSGDRIDYADFTYWYINMVMSGILLLFYSYKLFRSKRRYCKPVILILWNVLVSNSFTFLIDKNQLFGLLVSHKSLINQLSDLELNSIYLHNDLKLVICMIISMIAGYCMIHHDQIFCFPKLILSLALFFITSLFIIPSHSITNTSSVLYTTIQGDISFNYILVTISLTFIFIISTIFFETASINLAVTKFLYQFIWCYNCILILSSYWFTIIVRDILINVLNQTIDTTQAQSSLITSIFLNYYSHVTSNWEDNMEGISHQWQVVNFINGFNGLYVTAESFWYGLCAFNWLVVPGILLLLSHRHRNGENTEKEIV